MPFDVEKIRGEFPILSRPLPGGRRLAYLDNGATSQKPRCVIDRLSRFYAEENANIHRGLHHLSAEATTNYESAREYLSSELGLSDDFALVFTRGATEAINLVAHGLRGELKEGDEIIITLMEHHANFVPWQRLAEETGARLRFVPVAEDGQLDFQVWEGAFNERTRVAAFTHVSNALGTINPVARMVAFARERDVVTLVDGAQSAPHGPVDVGGLGCDFFTFSGHKTYGPDGVGVLAGRRELLDRFAPYQSGGDMIDRVSVEGTTYRESPERFEAGTPHIAGVLGLESAFRFLADIDWEGAHEHERELLHRATEGLESIGGVRIWGTAPEKAPIISFTMDDAHPQDIATILDNTGVAVRTGHHCCMPLMTHYGITGTARASFTFYNDFDDVDALIRGVEKVRSLFS